MIFFNGINIHLIENPKFLHIQTPYLSLECIKNVGNMVEKRVGLPS